MKKLFILFVFMIVSLCVVVPVYASSDDFYFSDFTADYYLSKDTEGISHLKVVENLTAVFPNYKQNKGICRQIPFSNQDGANRTLEMLNRDNIKVLRNGLDEPIYSIETYREHYEVCTGTDEYVLGEQKYTFEYEFEKVITDFGDYQELYWDTNGNGWYQKFNKLTVRVHFDDNIKPNYSGKKWCYVGKYGENNNDRCIISNIHDGLQFEAKDLLGGENVSIDIEFNPDTFFVPIPNNNYTYIIIMGILLLICTLFLIRPIKNFIQTRDKAKFYKGLFIKPEYQPDKKHSIAEMAEIYIGSKENDKVAVLLDMVVNRKIDFVKSEGEGIINEKWIIHVNNINTLKEEELVLLTIMNNGVEPKEKEDIAIKMRTATPSLIKLSKKYDETILSDLKRDKLVESSYKVGFLNSASNSAVTVLLLFFVFWSPIFAFLEGIAESINVVGERMVGQKIFWIISIIFVVATFVIRYLLKKQTIKYINHTNEGLMASRYMDGLKMYIKMAEADRFKMLQSVKGVDVSPEGIVKLYEKLLPYAAVFGLEKSWMEEMSKYCKLQEIKEPDYMLAGITASELSRSMRLASNVVDSSTHYSSSSISGGGGSSSSFSGGGGGGFSGGGGGGGGGGGR